jgi:hypothetical protein
MVELIYIKFISENSAVINLLAHGSQFLSNDGFGFRKIIEGNLWEQVMFRLVLHSTHESKPK